MGDHQLLTTTLFLGVVALTVGITFWASRQGSGTTDFYAGGRSFSGFQNGMAVSGDYMSAASFLGISGLIALNGYDGFLYSIGFLVAWLVALLLVAELLRNSGRYTMADQLAYRMRQTPVRSAAAALWSRPRSAQPRAVRGGESSVDRTCGCEEIDEDRRERAHLHVVAHASEASLAKVNVDDAFLAGFGICESLPSNLLCRSRRGHHV